MKRTCTLFLLIILLGTSGCKKTIEKIQQDMIISAMTDGQWKVTLFTENSVDITSSFSTYAFKYYSNKTVDAIKSGVVEKNGTWDGDAGTMTTSANFPGASTPLNLINGSWKITNNSWTFVEATQVAGGFTRTMRLDKI